MESVAGQFEIPGRFIEAVSYGSGHIHDTYLVRFRAGQQDSRYIFQQINREIFRDPVALMDNLAKICAHQREALIIEGASDADRRYPAVINARDGASHWVDLAGNYWRCFAFQEGTHSVDRVENEQQAYQIAKAFGSFAARMADFDAAELVVTIPRFHDLEHRHAVLEVALRDDTLGNAGSAVSEIERSGHWFDQLSGQLRAAGADELPTRVVHNDCKINNVLLDLKTGEGLCVIDLDTVMSGHVMSDFGELIRSVSGRANEDEVRPDAMSIDPSWLRGAVRGYLAGAGALLTPAELRVLPLAGAAMALENGIRFLTDHLLGDVYFRTRHAGQNLERCRAQLRLVELLSDRQEEIDALLAAAEADAGSLAE